MNILRYPGGKTKAIKFISQFITEKTVVSPFLGGASLEIFLANVGIKVIGYDIFEILINYWKNQLNNQKKLYEILKKIPPTKEKYFEIKQILKRWEKTQKTIFSKLQTNYYNEVPIKLDNEIAAAYFWYNFNLSYGPVFLGWPSSTYLNEKKYIKMIENVRDFKCPNLSVKCDKFENVLPRHKTDFLYLDPPYFLESDNNNYEKKVNKGLYPNPNFAIFHNQFNHELLRDLLLNHKGKFVLSYNNCDTIKNWYKDFDFYFPKWEYSMGLGNKRMGKFRNNRTSTKKESNEILIIKNK